MAIDSRQREFVRQRAHYCCEYCGTSETDAGGELTIDHFHPRSRGGSDQLDNLLYCCIHCNQFKGDYWQSNIAETRLWNPRIEPASLHFLEYEDGRLGPITETGEFTIRLLRLNRPALVASRLQKHESELRLHSIDQLHDMIRIYEQLLGQQSDIMQEQHKLLDLQRKLILQLLLGTKTEI